MDGLSVLHAPHNELVALPAELGHMETFMYLERLDVSHNQLRALPASLGHVVTLTLLDASYNNLKRVPPEVAQCTRLTALHLTNNPTLDSPPPHVVDSGLQACMDFLRDLLVSRQADTLNLDKWQFHRVPLDLADYLHITELSMCDNDLLVLPQQLSDMHNMRHLNVCRNRLPVCLVCVCVSVCVCVCVCASEFVCLGAGRGSGSECV